jgi:hypothetical protein
MAALVTKDPIWSITEAQGEELAKALREVAALHSITISPSLVAYGHLLAVSAAIYAPKVGIKMIQNAARKKAAKDSAILNGGPVESNAPSVDLAATNSNGSIKYQ